jgi:hypothetical protein
MDNYATHKKREILDWLAQNQRIRVHFTPTSASWMNLVEAWFGIIERQAIHRGTFGSVPELTTAIRQFINCWTRVHTRSSGRKPPTRSSPKPTPMAITAEHPTESHDRLTRPYQLDAIDMSRMNPTRADSRNIATCVNVGLYAHALTYGDEYAILARDTDKDQVKVRGDNGKPRWCPNYCFDMSGQQVGRLVRTTIDEPLDGFTA